MVRCKMILVGILCALGLQAVAIAQEAKTDLLQPEGGYRWQDAGRKSAKLDDKEIDQLAKDKILIVAQDYKQIFTPYLAPDMPAFITSDSLLNGFHALYEESIVQLEMANARKLNGILKNLWKKLETSDKVFSGKPQLVAAAKRRAQFTIAIAIQLLGDKPSGLETADLALIQTEAERVELAQGQAKPEWLGTPDPGFGAIDYSRFKPRGFYTRTAAMKRYFRAVSWLQAIPFRVGKDEELIAMLMLENSIGPETFSAEDEVEERRVGFFQVLRIFVGAGDDLSLGCVDGLSCSEMDLDSEDRGLSRVREDLIKHAKSAGRSQINDQLAVAPRDPAQVAEVAMRVLSSHRTPDAVMFQRTTDPRQFQRAFPDGLELGAVLGSPYARSRLAEKEPKELLAEIDRCKELFLSQSVYGEYLQCLGMLTRPEPDAPPFMSGTAWQIKSCQTILGGWAQQRHTWALQVKQNVTFLGGDRLPRGFVEPQPEFYARMARLAEIARWVLKQSGTFEIDSAACAADLHAALAVYQKELDDLKARAKGEPRKQLPLEEIRLLQMLETVCARLADQPYVDDNRKLDTKAVIALAEQLDRGQIPNNPRLVKALRQTSPDLAPRWQDFETLCRRLELLSHKQLRKVALNEDDNNFVGQYGEKLAKIMFYDGNSYCSPNDDAPRVVDVFSAPAAGKFLEVGVARPRPIYVLYPFESGEILCRGAVMPYCEFIHDSRLTDSEWKSLLDSDNRPKPPGWLDAITAPDRNVPSQAEREEDQ